MFKVVVSIIKIPINNKISSAYLVNNPAKKLTSTVKGAYTYLQLPLQVVDTFATVVAVNLEGEIKSSISNPIPSFLQKVMASSTMEDSQDKWNAKNLTDNNPKTSWRSSASDSTTWLDIDLGSVTSIGALALTEAGGRCQQFTIEYKDGADWKKLVDGKNIGNAYFTQFTPVKASHFRLQILKSKPGGIEIRDFQLFYDE